MPDSYLIITVEPEWVLNPEGMGSKTKFWYKDPGEEQSWLFKYPQPNTGQHWAEKLAEQVASFLRIPHARVELARFQGEYGSVTESFARGGRLLYHGNQVLEQTIFGYDPSKRFQQSDHTVEHIFSAMESTFISEDAAKLAKLYFAEYLVLDALIGNTDRHHENWGILRKRVGDGWKGFLAPSFDHASSLGRELRDERREKILAEDRVGNYIKKGRGAVYWFENEPHGPSPLELVRRAARRYPNIFRPALEKLESLDETVIRSIIYRIPDEVMTPLAREFAATLILYNFEQLRILTDE